MNILAMETTGAEASVAIINEKGEIFMTASDQKLNHLQNLMPMVDALLEKSGLLLDEVDYIAVSEGPGSFTGIRIGVSSARALAQALGLQTISVPTLKSFLYNVPDKKGILCPIFDARRNQIYGGAYQWIEKGRYGSAVGTDCYELPSGRIYKEIVPGAAYDLKEFLGRLEMAADQKNAGKGERKDITFFGDGIIPYREQIVNWQKALRKGNIRILFAEDHVTLQNAASVAKLALEIYRAGKIKSLYDLKPVYMRKAEAERKLEERS